MKKKKKVTPKVVNKHIMLKYDFCCCFISYILCNISTALPLLMNSSIVHRNDNFLVEISTKLFQTRRAATAATTTEKIILRNGVTAIDYDLYTFAPHVVARARFSFMANIARRQHLAERE